MIKIKFYKKNKEIIGFDCFGHAGYAEMGADIVCAAVSSLVQNAEIALSEVLGVKTSVRRNDKNAEFCLKLARLASQEDIEKSQPILKALEISAQRIEKEYKKFVLVEEVYEIV
ncbi:MAG: ribosomal-processing cysteine protease Prp [Clostridia bacterium]|nr:ribosomal-processing cysteine protease Prp [Clostridia bacterium]